MTYRRPDVAPQSILEPPRRGRQVGRFCRDCKSVFPLHLGVHSGKGLGLFGRDHVISPCRHEGEPFEPGDDWWEPAVEVLPATAPEDWLLRRTDGVRPKHHIELRYIDRRGLDLL